MRLILLTSLVALWAWFAIHVAPQASRRPRPVAVAAHVDGTSAESLHNLGVDLDRRGRPADALAYFERAASFKPLEPRLAQSVALQRARVSKRAWIRFLVPATIVGLFFLLASSVRRSMRRHRDRRLLRRLRMRGKSRFRISPSADQAEFGLRFNRDLGHLLERHPLTVVWSSARYGKHMKSSPPVEIEGDRVVVRLDRERIDRLRQYPGEWKGFVYLDGHAVGDTVARVG